MAWRVFGNPIKEGGKIAFADACCCVCCDCDRLEVLWSTGETGVDYLLATFTGLIEGIVKLYRRDTTDDCCVRYVSNVFTINEQVDPPPDNPTMDCLSGNAIEASIELAARICRKAIRPI